MFIVVSGVSSCGKNTVINELIKKRKDLRVLTQSSGTSRPPRESDSQFNTYVYFTDSEFEKGIEEGKFFEHEVVHGHYYGLIKARLEEVLHDKENDYIRDIDVKGTVNLKKFFKDNMISIFLDAPDEVLRGRLISRGDTPEDIERRLSRGELERSYKVHYDLCIDNIDLDKTVKTILEFLDEKKKTK